MTFHSIPLETFPRKAHFEYFSGLANPYAGLTAEVEITELLKLCKEGGYSFFLTFLHRVMAAANAVPQLRQRILDGGIVEFDYCPASYTLLRPDETYVYCTQDCRLPLKEYLPQAKAAMETAQKEGALEDGEDALALMFVSSVPWVSFTALIQPTPSPADSNPRLTWGKYFQREGKTYIPVSVLAHHALVDGIHIGRFYENLEKALHDLNWIQPDHT